MGPALSNDGTPDVQVISWLIYPLLLKSIFKVVFKLVSVALRNIENALSTSLRELDGISLSCCKWKESKKKKDDKSKWSDRLWQID